MSILKEINDLNNSLKALAINVFLIPFWYVAIFLFNNEFYTSSDNLIILSMTIVISLSSSGFLTFLLHLLNFAEVNSERFLNETMVSVLLLTTWISLLIFIIYSLGFLFNIYIYFYYFLLIYFSPLAIILILKIFSNKKDDKKTEQSNSTTNKK